MMFHAMSGLGQCVGGYDEYGDACTDFTPITSDPVATATANQYLNNPSVPVNAINTVTGTPATGFNWGILASVIPSLAQTAGATTASVLNAQTNAQTAASLSAAQIAASQASSTSSSSLMMLGLAAAAVVLVVVMSRGKH
jgi:hypothetical protein